MPSPLFQMFQQGQGSALIAVISCALLSILAINFVWIRAIGVSIYSRVKRAPSQEPTQERIFFRTQLGLYIICLLSGNLLSNVGYAINITWVLSDGIEPGALCSTQGALSQIGDTATAYFTAAIAVHTFCTLALRSRLPQWLAYLAIGLGWVLVLAAGIVPGVIPVTGGPIYGTDGSICGISLQYPAVQTLIHLVPIFLASLVSSVFYSLVFLIIRGTLTIKGGLKFTLDPVKRWNDQIGTAEYHKFIGAIAQGMLWYPVAYVLLIFPHIIVCLLETSGIHAPFAAKVVAITCSALNGVANVLIFYNTLRIMGPVFKNATNNTDDVEKSFGTRENQTPSPVDVAPPVAAIIAERPRAFPPPRSFTPSTYSRATSVYTDSGDSTRHLLAPRPTHGRTDSAATGTSSQQSIVSIAELERNSSTKGGLPVPRRQGRSPVIRRPTMSIEVPSRDDEILTPVALETALPDVNTSRRARESFIKMYGANSATIFDEKTQRLTFGDESAMISQGFRSVSPGYSSSSSGFSGSGGMISDDDVPLSPFMGELVRRTSQTIRSPSHQRSASDLRTPAGGMSSLAVATLRKNEMAAASNAARLKASRRRSKSMESLKPKSPPRGLPSRPSSPLGPRTASLYSSSDASPLSSIGRLSTPRSTGGPHVTLHDGPSRTPTFRRTPEGRSYI